MYTVGINTFLFASPFTDQEVMLFPRFREWGFDAVEIVLEAPEHIHPALVKVALEENNLSCCAICAAMGPGRDLRGSFHEQRTALDYLMRVMDCMAELDCHVLAGPLYSSVGRAEAVPGAEKKMQWETVATHLRILSQYAAQRKIILAIEPLNRFETDLINTCEQGLQMIHDVDHPSLKLHLDTFHMNIEEKDQAAAIVKAGAHLAHFHACGSDRGTPGKDHINWPAIVNALKQVNYTGSIAIESFTQDVSIIAKAAAIWRMIERSQEDIAKEGARFLRARLNG